MFTQGKWQAEPDIFDENGHKGWIVSNEIRVIAEINSACGLLPPEETEANARLIAAAPELLSACKFALKYAYAEETTLEAKAVRERTKRAIAKAQS